MKKFLAVISLAIALAFPTTALAYSKDDWPVAWRDDPVVTKGGITYVLVDDPNFGEDYHFASVVAINPKKEKVTIPFCVFEGGRRYDVGSICEETFSECPKLKHVYLMAELEECDDLTLFVRDERDVTIHVYTQFDYEWMTREGNDSHVVAEF